MLFKTICVPVTLFKCRPVRDDRGDLLTFIPKTIVRNMK